MSNDVPSREALPLSGDDNTPEPGPMPTAPAAPVVAAMPVAPPVVSVPPPLAPAPLAPPPLAPAPLAPKPLEARPVEVHKPTPAQTPAAPTPAVRVSTSSVAGEEYPETLGQVVRAARARGAESTERYGDETTRARLRASLEQAARSVGALSAGATIDRVTQDALYELTGGGALESALEDAEVTSVLVESSGRVLAGRGGPLSPCGWFSGPAAVTECLDRMLRTHGASRDEGATYAELQLADGVRVVAVFPPAVSQGPVVSVERSPTRAASLSDLAARGVLSAGAAAALGQSLGARRNVLVVGPSGSGRTTVLAALLQALPPSDRVAVVESRDELGRSRRDAIALRAQGDWSAALAVLPRLGARRVVFGETVEGVAKALFGGLTTGSEGWLAAVDAPTAETGVSKLCALASLGSWFGRDEAVARVAATRPLVIETARFGDGVCRITRIGEVRGVEGDLFYEPLFTARVEPGGEHGLQVQMVSTGASASFA